MTFLRSDGLAAALREEVGRYFAETGRSQRGDWRMYLKTALLLGWFAAAYGLLCFAVTSAWLAVPLAISLGLCMTGLGFNVMHDGNHGSFSHGRGWNYTAGLVLDMLGGSSFLWRYKHNVSHHTYPNIDELDDDILFPPLARMAPSQRHRWPHRWQHLYMWPLYGFLAIKWHFIDDFLVLWKDRIAGQRFPRPRGEVAVMFVGKLLFYTWALIVPALFHPLWVVLVYYAITAITLGMSLGTVFQLAHCVPEASFVPAPPPDRLTLEQEWAVHQIGATSNFGCSNWLLTICVGGLNFQIEHHLFPRICHVHYPALRPIVKATCARFGVPYHEHETFLQALRAHGQWLLKMGRPPQ